ncbi:MAG: sulfurtransferase [Hydrogenophaga sp.]|uniref:sulfurtransferase n=1 Tax=Hydrogenophaga sp. TaxID=1904254 RepID=UPI001DFD75C3|nr:sulfurtransferase [Hydrogenophaga sp.]MBX3609984.1 sulfurtransferase [Hydrogenophaga sp.]
MYSTLIQPSELMALRNAGTPVLVLDSSFDLSDPGAGRAQFEREHLPGSLYVHLDHDLSDKSRPASEGRHPLPDVQVFAGTLARLGLNQGTQVVVLDRQGANYCGRLWWMLRWAGHDAVAVLDGGLPAWKAAGGAIESGPTALPAPGNFQFKPALTSPVDTASLLARLGRADTTVIDARAAARFCGEVEPLDPVAGHIPGALNRPFGDNLQADGRFKTAEQLRAEFLRLLGGRDPATVVHHCGSGVSALPNVLAMEIAGLSGSQLYPGSWSAWCNTEGTPRARG